MLNLSGLGLLLGWTALVALLSEVTARLPSAVAVFVGPLVAGAIATGWLIQGVGTGFLFAKLLSVGFGASMVVWFCSRWPGGGSRTLAWVLYGTVVVNILEAVAAESVTAVSANFFAGLVLLVGLPRAAAFRVHHGGALTTDCRVDLTWLWIAAYTLWNFAFVYGTSAPGDPPGGGTWMTSLHLGVPLLLSRGDASRWLQNRALALCLTFLAVVDAEPLVDGASLYRADVASGLGWLALGLAIAAGFQRLRMRGTP